MTMLVQGGEYDEQISGAKLVDYFKREAITLINGLKGSKHKADETVAEETRQKKTLRGELLNLLNRIVQLLRRGGR